MSEQLSYSPHAIRLDDVLDPAKGKRRSPWGLLVHTTGGGVASKAARTGRPAIEIALAVYREMQSDSSGSQGYRWGGPTYVLDYDGTLFQLSPDEIQTAHCGHPHRDLYLLGDWGAKCSPATVAHWRQQWPTFPSPQYLYPGRSPNEPYIGVEMLQLPERRSNGLRFTDEQHRRVVELALDLGHRHGWPEQWHQGPRLLGHEDVSPITRHDAGGGWDPGTLRDEVYFDFERVRRELRG